MKHYTYILYSKSTNTFYKGSTKNLIERVNRHNTGREKYTRTGKPWILLWYSEKPNKSEAYLLERKLKNLSVKRTIEFMIKYEDGIAGPDELAFVRQLSGC